MNGECLIILIYPMISDLKYKRFYIEPILVSSMICLLNEMVNNELEILNVILGAIPGIVTLLLSLVTKGAIGIGDGVIIAGIGMIVGWESICAVCFVALLLSAVCGLCLILIHKANKKTEMAFVPFICAAYLFVCICERSLG